MAVTTIARRIALAGGGGLPTSWPVALPVMSTADITAYHVVTATEVVTNLTQGNDYTLTLDTPGDLPSTFQLDLIIGPGSFFAAGIPAGEEIRVVRSTQITQDQTFVQGDPLPESVLELIADKLTLIGQDAKEIANRSLTGPESDPISPLLTYRLPSIADRIPVAGDQRFLTFDVNGEPTVAAGSVPPAETVSPAMAGFLNSASINAALAFLDTQRIEFGTDAARVALGAVAFGVGWWYTTDTNMTYYSDGATWSSLVWNLDGAGSPITLAVPAGIQGRIYRDTVLNQLYWDTGAFWAQVGSLFFVDENQLSGAEMTWINSTRISFSRGTARSENGTSHVSWIAQTKDINAAGTWAVGTASPGIGATDIAAGIANKWFSVWLVGENPTGIYVDDSDFGYSGDADGSNLAADLPGTWTLMRRVGWIYIDGANQVPTFVQEGDHFRMTNVRSARTITTSSNNYTAGRDEPVFAPPNVEATLLFRMSGGAGAGEWVNVETIDQVHAAPTNVSHTHDGTANTIVTRSTFRIGSQAAAGQGGRLNIRNVAASPTTYDVTLEGWIDRRGKDRTAP